ncbi:MULTISPECIES: hypothetical protein [Bacillus cereus group]|uniref:hypothetical protein n=1 Tax=Bacillus cereus group TaxID=86661 RepID=UPI0009754773|nr:MULTISPECIES: hypothetical protein [Bacillus cereus group]ONH02934.1 hypothetical protein BKK45_00365 [Bacillus cereus]PFZ93474.1 hypothetical protein COL78_22340 [Bacillus wiedmannii]
MKLVFILLFIFLGLWVYNHKKKVVTIKLTVEVNQEAIDEIVDRILLALICSLLATAFLQCLEMVLK